MTEGLLTKKYISKYINSIPVHRPELRRFIGDCDYIQNTAFVDEVYSFFNILSRIGFCSKKSYQSFIDCCIAGYLNGEVCLFSVCSHALTADPTKLRKKKQNAKIRQIHDQLRDMGRFIPFRIRYVCILPDTDRNYSGPEYMKSWEANREMIKLETGVDTFLLSEISENQFNNIYCNLGEFVDLPALYKEIEYYEKNNLIILGFYAEPDFQRTQILSYTTTGLLLEKYFPNAVLLDVQKKQFPFEQKFYNYGRCGKLPMFFCGQELIPWTISIREKLLLD